MAETDVNNVTSLEDKGTPIDSNVQNDPQPPLTGNIQERPPPLPPRNEKNRADAMTTTKSAEPTEHNPTPASAATAAAAAPTPASAGPAPSPEASNSSNTRGAAPEKPSTGSLSATGTSNTTTANNDSCGLPPPDFQGEVETNNELPSPETLRRIESYTVLDADGKSHTFKSLYAGHNVARRVMIIFVRHFFCGNCQEYLRTLSAAITPDALLQLPVSTFIAVVGCGGPELIPFYARETGCPFPVYTDPTRKLYAELGMLATLRLGPKPAYLGDRSFAGLIAASVVQGLRQVKSGLVTKSGDHRQVGGEFLFEPVTGCLEPPIATPPVADGVGAGSQEQQQQHRDDVPVRKGGGDDEDEDESRVEPKHITWCHRMKTTRDHAEIPELMEVLGLEATEDGAIPIAAGKRDDKKQQQRWSKAMQTRKGTGLSMASQMSRMSLEASAAASIGGGGVDGVSPNSGRSSVVESREAAAKIRSVSPSNGVAAAAATSGGAVDGKSAV